MSSIVFRTIPPKGSPSFFEGDFCVIPNVVLTFYTMLLLDLFEIQFECLLISALDFGHGGGTS